MAQIHASFTTSYGGHVHTCGVVVDRRETNSEFTAPEFAALARAAYRPDAAAFGKIAVLRRNGIAVYQADTMKPAALAFCGNATAAALRLLRGEGDSRSIIYGRTTAHEVHASIRGLNVAQTWIVPETTIEERRWRTHRVLLLETLNHYAMIEGHLEDGEAETARRELLGDGLSAKVAVVSRDGAALTFYNSNGRHGAAPQTGLASVALVARAVPWFAEMVRTEPLPAIEATSDGRLAITMPSVTVELSELTLPVAA